VPHRAVSTLPPVKSVSRRLVTDIRTALRARADPAKAGPMQAYMKSTMPYLGVQTPGVRAACRAVFAMHRLSDFTSWHDTALSLWRTATHREERYAAIELTGWKTYRDFQTLAALPLYEEMITTGAWWDYVDVIAIHRIGPLLGRFPTEMDALLRTWATSADLWKRRSAILCQLSFKRNTDLELLYGCIAPSMQRPEFFLRKGIGWALREHAKTDPRGVIRYVKLHKARLSPLTKREALRNVIRLGLLRTIP
jgi:3-methyladenine DNA glycosylase AlkD